MWAKTGYTLTQPDAVQARFQTINGIRGGKPLYNIRPNMKVPFVCQNERGENALVGALFGFIPPWESPSDLGGYPHARSEEIQTKPSFRDAFLRNRCLVIVDGFFVWDQQYKPYYVRLKTGGLFGIAGIFSLNYNYKPMLISFALLTTFPNVLIMDVHHRMPVIIRAEDEARYLDPVTPINDVKNMLVAYDDEQMEMYRVTSWLNEATDNMREYARPLRKGNSETYRSDIQEYQQLTWLD